MPLFRVRTIPLSSVIKFGSESEPLNLINITSNVESQPKNAAEFLKSDGCYVYETKFVIDEKEAFRQGIIGIKFETFFAHPQTADVPLKENEFTVDIKQPPISMQPDPRNIQKAVISLKSVALQHVAQVAPALKAVSLSQPIATMPFKEIAKKSENVTKKDPAQALAAGKTLGTTPKNVLNFGVQNFVPGQKSQNFESLGSMQPKSAFKLSDRRAQLKDDRHDKQDDVVNSFLNLKAIVDPNSLVRTQPVAMVEVLSRNVEYTRHMNFQKSNLTGYNKLYVRVSGVVRDGVVAKSQQRVYIIAHAAEVAEFIGNPEPPEILLSESTFGKVSFILRRKDPTLRRIYVVRITKNPNIVSTKFEKVGMLEFGNSDQLEFVNSVDNVAPNTIIYRFVVMNEDGSSGEFTSSVLTSFTKVSDQKKVLTSTTPISIRARNTVEGIEVAVDTTNDQVYSLRLLRQDLGLTGEFSETVKTILNGGGRYSTVLAGEKTTMLFQDTDVIRGRHYRYFAAYRLGTGAGAALCQEMISDEDESIVRVQAPIRPQMVAALTPANISQDESGAMTVKFEMSVSEVEEQYNTLLDALRQAGVSQQFITDLQNDRQKLKLVAAFLVERVDRVSGRRVSFGIFPPGTFSDSPEIRDKFKLPDLLPGRKYEYICKLCIRPDKTFLLSATVGFTARADTSGVLTEVLAAKFQNALIGAGILPSEMRLREGVSIRENFFLGFIGTEESNTVILPNFDPKIENLTIKEKSIYNLIKWNTSGDFSNVSYFLVYCNYNGTRELLGTVSSVGHNSTYQYKDTRFYDEVGSKSYFVTAVTLDHDVSISSPKVETVTEFSIPAAVLDGYILSPSRYEVKGVVMPGLGPKLNTQQVGFGGFGAFTAAVVGGFGGFGGGHDEKPKIVVDEKVFDPNVDLVSSNASINMSPELDPQLAPYDSKKQKQSENVPPTTSRINLTEKNDTFQKITHRI
jgi:hypothetical protein